MALKSFAAMPTGHVSISMRLLLSYVLDWVLIIGVALIGFGFSEVDPNHRAFSLSDPSISFPNKPSTVPTGAMAVVAVVGPAVIIALVSLLCTPGASIDASASRALIWRRKLWEWHAGWLGLGVAAAGVFMATEGLKDLYGRPRPDLLARCDPDLSDIPAYAVGGLGQRLAGAPTLVTWEICRNKGEVVRRDGFASFPSGHASLSFAGLTYLSLWLCSKFSVKFPYLPHTPLRQDLRAPSRLSIRSQGAAPPIYLVIVAFVPFAVAFFIAASRWFDYQHHAFDIIFGSAMGVVFAWVGFRLYSPPIMRGSGWSWGARSRDHAFFKAVGLPSNIGDDNWATSKDIQTTAVGSENRGIDLENGTRNLSD